MHRASAPEGLNDINAFFYESSPLFPGDKANVNSTIASSPYPLKRGTFFEPLSRHLGGPRLK